MYGLVSVFTLVVREFLLRGRRHQCRTRGHRGSLIQALWNQSCDDQRQLLVDAAAALEAAILGGSHLGIEGPLAPPRLYEHWVYLQVLLAAWKQLGPPEPRSFAILAVQIDGWQPGHALLAGTTVSFAGGVHIAFEPTFTLSGLCWMGVEYVPHPDPKRRQRQAVPDVVILSDGEPATMVVIDAKHVRPHLVERVSVEIHEKYGRMRLRGNPIVISVLAAHPNPGVAAFWSGYGHIPVVPGSEPLRGPLRSLFPVVAQAPWWSGFSVAPEAATAPPPENGGPPPNGEHLEHARASILSYVRSCGRPVPLAGLGTFLRREHPRLSMAPPYGGAGTLKAFLKQFVPELEHRQERNGEWSVVLPKGVPIPGVRCSECRGATGESG